MRMEHLYLRIFDSDENKISFDTSIDFHGNNSEGEILKSIDVSKVFLFSSPDRILQTTEYIAVKLL